MYIQFRRHRVAAAVASFPTVSRKYLQLSPTAATQPCLVLRARLFAVYISKNLPLVFAQCTFGRKCHAATRKQVHGNCSFSCVHKHSARGEVVVPSRQGVKERREENCGTRWSRLPNCAKIISENEPSEEFVESRKPAKRRCKKLVKAALVAYIRNTVYDIFATNESRSLL